MAARVISRVRRSVVVPVVLALIQLMSATAEPILHGRAEVLSSGRGFEQSHTDRCAVIHIEASCVGGSLHHRAGSAPRTIPVDAHRLSEAPLSYRSQFLAPSGVSLANGVRAPPRG